MINLWHKFIAGDCMVIKIGNHFTFPIFKNGYSSLNQTPDRKIILNKSITSIKETINVVIRDPEWRFVSGFNQFMFDTEYSESSNDWSNTVGKAYDQVKQNKLTDAHFIPQFIWLMQLSKYHKGDVALKDISYLKNVTSLRKNQQRWQPKEQTDNIIKVAPIDAYVDVDKELMKHMNTTINLSELVGKYKNVLS